MNAIDKMLKFHKSSCTLFVYSGDRHCSCGRDEAAAELAAMQEQIEDLKLQLAHYEIEAGRMDRVQRSRKRGARLPENTLLVTRPGTYGNPYKVTAECTREQAIVKFRENLPEFLKGVFIAECKRNHIEHIACWCELDKPCHGDVWIEIWNEYLRQN